jgi:hypothetical protein
LPKINRIRIANVSWEHRVITDELYNSYDGQNLLLNLANGGGKSVLVQMMLQPILPTQRLRKRKIDDYLSTTSAPTYILLEWKLDNSPFYLLTGIAMCSIGQSGDGASRTKYFTFTNYYERGNEYDIKNFPFIIREENGVKYVPYEEARRKLKATKGDAFELRCFAFDESEAYQAELMKYGILSQEWKVLAEINDKEGGVDELFSACRTSDSLMNRWILKTVSEELNQGSTALFDALLGLMSSILDAEDKLKEKKLLDDFSGRTEAIQTGLSTLCDGLEKAERAAGELSGLHAWLLEKKKALGDRLAEYAARKDELREAQTQIDREDASECYWRREEEADAKKKLFGDAEAILKSAALLCSQAKRQKKCWEAARFAQRWHEEQGRILSLREQLKTLYTGSEGEIFRRVSFTLWERYGSALAQTETSLSGLDQSIETDERTLEEANRSQAKLENRMGNERQELGAVRQRIESFSEAEGKMLGTLSLEMRRNLENELAPEDVERARTLLRQRADNLARERQRLAAASANRLQAAARVAERKNAEQEREAAGIREEQSRTALDAFEKAEKSCLRLLARNGIEASCLYNAEQCRGILGQNLERTNKDCSELQRRQESMTETLQDCVSGTLHADRRFGELLEHAGISFETGESYLRQRPKEEQDACLRKNPMLPFSFVVSRKDLRRIPMPEEGGAMNRVCPVVAYDEISIPCRVNGRFAELSDDFRLACFYDERSLKTVSREIYQKQLQARIGELQKSSELLQKKRTALERDIQTLADFPYTAGSRAGLTKAHEDAKKARSAWNGRLAFLEDEIEKGRKEAERLAACLHQIEKKAQTAENNLKLFSEFLQQNERFMQDSRTKSELERALREGGERLAASKKSIRLREEDIREKRAQRQEMSQRQRAYTQKRAELGTPEKAKPLDWALDQMEEWRARYLAKQNESEQSLHRQIEEAAKAQAEAAQTLRSQYAHLPRASYEGLPFTEEALAAATEKADGASRSYETALRAHSKAESEWNTAAERLRDAEQELKKAGLERPLPPKQIFGDYQRRRAEAAAEVKQLEHLRQQCEAERNSLDIRTNSIRRYIKPENIKPLPAPREGLWDDFDIEKLGGSYLDQRKQNDKCREGLQNSLGGLRADFSDKHPVLSKFLENIPVDQDTETYEACYFLYERMADQSQTLEKWRKVLELALAHLDQDKRNVIRQALMQGRDLYEGLRKMSNASRVALWPGSPPRQTLKIGVPDVLDGDEEKRMTAYVESCIQTLRSEKEQGALDEDRLRKKIGEMFADRELLGIVVNQINIPVSLIKVDRRPENSVLRSWEKVLVENSGGEFFVSCFVLISALMSYKRDSVMRKSGVRETTRVFLIDNPFGKTSSKHLLEAMLHIAARYHTQLICLSDLNQSSITDCFAVIYQLVVRQGLFSRNSYLRTGNMRVNGEFRLNERLEHAGLYTPPEQMRLFDE